MVSMYTTGNRSLLVITLLLFISVFYLVKASQIPTSIINTNPNDSNVESFSTETAPIEPPTAFSTASVDSVTSVSVKSLINELAYGRIPSDTYRNVYLITFTPSTTDPITITRALDCPKMSFETSTVLDEDTDSIYISCSMGNVFTCIPKAENLNKPHYMTMGMTLLNSCNLEYSVGADPTKRTIPLPDTASNEVFTRLMNLPDRVTTISELVSTNALPSQQEVNRILQIIYPSSISTNLNPPGALPTYRITPYFSQEKKNSTHDSLSPETSSSLTVLEFISQTGIFSTQSPHYNTQSLSDGAYLPTVSYQKISDGKCNQYDVVEEPGSGDRQGMRDFLLVPRHDMTTEKKGMSRCSLRIVYHSFFGTDVKHVVEVLPIQPDPETYTQGLVGNISPSGTFSVTDSNFELISEYSVTSHFPLPHRVIETTVIPSQETVTPSTENLSLGNTERGQRMTDAVGEPISHPGISFTIKISPLSVYNMPTMNLNIEFSALFSYVTNCVSPDMQLSMPTRNKLSILDYPINLQVNVLTTKTIEIACDVIYILSSEKENGGFIAATLGDLDRPTMGVYMLPAFQLSSMETVDTHLSVKSRASLTPDEIEEILQKYQDTAKEVAGGTGSSSIKDIVETVKDLDVETDITISLDNTYVMLDLDTVTDINDSFEDSITDKWGKEWVISVSPPKYGSVSVDCKQSCGPGCLCRMGEVCTTTKDCAAGLCEANDSGKTMCTKPVVDGDEEDNGVGFTLSSLVSFILVCLFFF